MTSDQTSGVTLVDAASAQAVQQQLGPSIRRIPGAPAAEITAAVWGGATTLIVDDVAAARQVVDLVLDVMNARTAP